MTKTAEAMINVEGNYDEIIDYLDEYPMRPVGHAISHGMQEDMYDDAGLISGSLLNFGLFSICKTETSKGEWHMFNADPPEEGIHFNYVGWVTKEELSEPGKIVF